MTYVKRFKTMYMHTLDGQPATFDQQYQSIFMANGRSKAMLVPSLRHIQREQQADIRQMVKEGRSMQDRQRALERYSYVLVEVPL